ncbi:hypothetical protein BDV12DRAFT_187150 [Aspergillus spectabilis]
MLNDCPSLKDFSDETFLEERGSRGFQGLDMVLLSRIRLAQGLLDESLRLTSKALTFRRGCLGEHLKVCDSLYDVARLHSLKQNTEQAVQLLEDCIKISGNLPQIEGIGHQARANYKLSLILRDSRNEEESMVYLDRAVLLRESFYRINGSGTAENRDASGSEKLVPWMLWW